MKASIVNNFAYLNEKQKNLHIFLIQIYNSFTEKDYLLYIKDIEKLVDFSAGEYKVKTTFTAFKYAAEYWLQHKFIKLSQTDIAALNAKARQMEDEGKDVDAFFIYCLSVQPKPKQKHSVHFNNAEAKPKQKLNFEYLRVLQTK